MSPLPLPSTSANLTSFSVRITRRGHSSPELPFPKRIIGKCGLRPPWPLLFLSLFLALCHRQGVAAVRCYCTDEHCVPYGVCEATVCLVGLLRANNAVIRTCGNEPLGCQRNLDRWAHICSCDAHFCNTFLFLKANTNIDGGRGGGGEGRRRTEAEEQDQHGGGGGGGAVFQRVDPGDGEFATFDHPMGEEDERTIKNSNLLTLLLVIVPLSVGAAAVVVVAINYYCHLC